METKANYTLIGAFTALSLCMLAVFAVWLANTGVDRSYARYDVVFEGPVRGLERGGEVRFNGIKVGEVEDLRLGEDSPTEVVARIKVDANTPVKVDSLAQLEPAGLTGLAFIQILAGAEASPLMRARLGEGPPVIASRKGQLDRLFSGSEGVLQTSLETLARLNTLMSPENIANLSKALANLEAVTGDVSNRTAGVLDSANAAALSVSGAGRDVAVLSASLNQLVSPGGAYAQFGTSLNQLSGQAGSLLETSQTAITTASGQVTELSERSGRAIDETTRTMVTARTSLDQIGAAAVSMETVAGQLGTASGEVQVAAGTINGFFDVATRQTLPDMNRAAQTVSSAAVTFDSIASAAAADPGAILAPPPQREVKWRQ
jgi:phospholipid/cholesterol/gamma-HCH transport system substrate-binding protein